MEGIISDVDKINRLELLGRSRPKIPLRQDPNLEGLNINRSDASTFL